MGFWANEAVRRAHDLLRESRRVLVGAGAGLSTAAGLHYDGERFERAFAPFIEKYGMADMYSASFYPFASEEERWAYWAQHVAVNRYEPGALPLYRAVMDALSDKDYFVVTTNVDAQFELAGCAPDRLFAVQGDYGLLQCARGCHDRLYPNEQLVDQLFARTCDCRVPSELVPRCPVCGGPMAVHVRVDGRFVEDGAWHAAQRRYAAFVEGMEDQPTLLLELGVGWNTPGIIRLPFEAMARAYACPLVRMNYGDAGIADAGLHEAVSLEGDIAALWPFVAGGMHAVPAMSATSAASAPPTAPVARALSEEGGSPHA